MFEPTRREFITAIGHVLAAEHAEAKHIGRVQIRFELRMEVATSGLDALVPVILLHLIIDRDQSSHIGAGPEIDDGLRGVRDNVIAAIAQQMVLSARELDYARLCFFSFFIRCF
jgi:hypothetical protein